MDDRQKLDQIRVEYEEGKSFLDERKQRWTDQLVLMNNLQRGDENIASTMLFSYFTRVHANLYGAKLESVLSGANENDYKKNDALNKLYRFDYEEMCKDVIDYDWLWDALFFSRGYCDTMTFDKKRKIMVPHVINPLMFGYDPYFPYPKHWRYYWYWMTVSSSEIQRMYDKKVCRYKPDQVVTGIESNIWDYKVQREQAKDVTSQGQDSISAPTPAAPNSNGVHQILKHFTHFEGKKTLVWTDRDLTKILYEQELKLNDDPDNKGESLFPIVIREVFREPHATASTSIPDLLEDKHRALNVLENLAYIAAKDEVNPIYEYVPEDIVDTSQLFQRQILQHIPVEKLGSIQPLKTKPSLSNSILQFMQTLRNEASEPLGTAQVGQPPQKSRKSATETAVLQQIAELAQSLQSKILAQGEREFISHWYHRYINNIKSGDIKMVEVTGLGGVTFESITLEDIKTKFPPRVKVTSAKEAEYKEMVERRELAQQISVLEKALKPDQFQMFLRQVWFPKFKTFDIQTIDLILPKSLDILKAEQENTLLDNDKLPTIDATDNDEAHLYVHAQAKITAATIAHRVGHEWQLGQKKKKEEEAAAQGNNPGQGTPGPKPSPKNKEVNPADAATPAAQNQQTNNSTQSAISKQ